MPWMQKEEFQIERGAKLPVIVWIHDQRSESGISNDTPETGYRDNLAARDLVAITFNYRFSRFHIYIIVVLLLS